MVTVALRVFFSVVGGATLGLLSASLIAATAPY